MVMKFTNNATSTLASSITSIATSLTVAGGQGALFPTLTASDYFYCTLANSSGTIEIIKVTARSTDTFTITRAQDNTVASAFTAGDKVELRLVAASLNDLPKLDEANTFSAANTFSTTLGVTGAATLSSTLGVTGVSTLTAGAVIQGLTVGKGAGAQSTNTAVGASALASNSSSGSMTALGYQALYSATSGQNTAVGSQSFYTNGAGGYNTGIGVQSGYLNTSGSYNTALGHSALYSNTTASNNTAVGYQAGYSVTTGGVNTFVGRYAGYYVTTGINNTVLGGFNGNQSGLDIRTSSNHIVLSDGDGNPRGWFNSSGSGFFSGATVVYPGSGNTNTGIFLEGNGQLCVSRDNTVAGRFNRNSTDGTLISCARQGTEVGTIGVTTSATSYNTSSDYRLKNTIAPMTGALAKVSALKPVTYKWNVDGSDGEGFIAHELAEVCPNAVTGEKDAVETYLDIEGNEQTRPKYQGIDTSFLVATLTAAIQELKAEVDSLKAQINGASA